MPAPGPDRRLAGESFAQFNREILALLRRREVLIALLLFITPCSSFALTNILGGLGADFHASPRSVSLAGGTGAFLSGLAGCLIFPLIARRMRLRLFYLVNGVVGCLFTLGLLLLTAHAIDICRRIAGRIPLSRPGLICIQIGIVFETIGKDNPLAATTFAFLTAATNIPVTYMMVIDGRGLCMGGLVGSFTLDAGIGICRLSTDRSASLPSSRCRIRRGSQGRRASRSLVAGRLSKHRFSPPSSAKKRGHFKNTEVST